MQGYSWFVRELGVSMVFLSLASGECCLGVCESFQSEELACFHEEVLRRLRPHPAWLSLNGW
jgi:hypothetical protein